MLFSISIDDVFKKKIMKINLKMTIILKNMEIDHKHIINLILSHSLAQKEIAIQTTAKKERIVSGIIELNLFSFFIVIIFFLKLCFIHSTYKNIKIF